MSENQFFEKRGPFPLREIIKVIGCSGDFSQENNVTLVIDKIYTFRQYRFKYNRNNC